jgi:hypothetical protein
VRGLRGRRIRLFVESPDDVAEQRQYEQRNQGDDRHQYVVVKPMDIAGDIGHPALKPDLALHGMPVGRRVRGDRAVNRQQRRNARGAPSSTAKLHIHPAPE